jgi:hypothetical protein
MKSKLIVPALVAASLFGAPAIAFAQSEAATPPTENNIGAKAPAQHKMKSTERARFHQGTTTGMGSSRSAAQARPGGESVARKPAGE